MPPAAFPTYTRPDGRSSRSPEPGASAPSPRIPSPASRATPRGHISQLDAVTMSGDMLLPGCSGLVKTLPLGEEGISENFLSLWLSSLCIHVHPKKQPKALGFLIARHVRAVAHKVIRSFHEHVLESNRRRQINKKAILHWMGFLCGDVIRLWRSKAVALRVARIRLRTQVSRWLRVELGSIFSNWWQQVIYTRTLFTASERVSKRHQHLCIENAFKDWVAHMEEQEHRKNVLTKIVLRVQDRTLLKALHVWLQLASSLAIIKHLAEQGLRKYRATTIVNAFQSWQDLRTRGFKAMDMMDFSVARWNKKMIQDCFDALRDLTQHSRICNGRGLLVWARHVSEEQRKTIERWNWFCWTRRRLATIGETLLSKDSRERQMLALRGWAAHVEAIRTRYGLLRKGLGNHCIREQLSTFAQWWRVTSEEQTLRTIGGRIRAKSEKELGRRVVEGWKEATELSLQLLALHDRIEVKHNSAVAQDVLLSWAATTRGVQAVRQKALAAFTAGEEMGKRRKLICVRGWGREVQRVRQLEGAMRLNAVRGLLGGCLDVWLDNAAALRGAAQRFERAYYRSEVGLVARYLSLWVEEHTRTVVRSNKLMTLMMVWDKRRVYTVFNDWVDEVKDRKQVRRFINSSTIRQMMARARAVLVEWGAAAYWRRVLRVKADRLLRGQLARGAARHLGAWQSLARTVKLMDRGIGKIRHCLAQQVVSAALEGWAALAEETSYKALLISRRDTAMLFRLAREVLQAWATQTAVTAERSRRLKGMEGRQAEKAAGEALGEWFGCYQQQAALRMLRERCLTRWLSACGEEAFAWWAEEAAAAAALRSKEGSVRRGRRLRLAVEAMSMWAVETVRLRKLRRGLRRVVGAQEERAGREVLWEWQAAGRREARHERVARACSAAREAAGAGEVLAEWGAAARGQRRQERGLRSLAGRVELQAVGAAVRGWEAAARRERGHARAARLIQMRRRLSRGREAWGEWRGVVEERRLFGERLVRMAGARAAVAGSDVLFWWRRHALLTRRRFEGLARCARRQAGKVEHGALAGWFEVAAYKKRLRASVLYARQKREWAAVSEAVGAMWQTARVGRYVWAKAEAKQGEVARRVWEGWQDMCVELERKRRGLGYILRRWELRVQAAVLAGWCDELAALRGLYGRAQLVESRNMSVAVTGAVLKLVQHAKTRKRHRRLQTSFFQRWYVACLKNFFEAWRSWYGKKMAVKGVLDQVVEMM